MSETPKRRNRKRRSKRRSLLRWIVALVLIAALAAVGWLVVNRYYMIMGGQVISRDADLSDLREYTLSESEYLSVAEENPELDIRWNVPLSAGRFDSASESLTLSSFTREDLEKLSYFHALRSLDIREADVAPELYTELAKALPGVDVRWSVPIGGVHYDSGSQTLTLSADFSSSELPMFDCFPALQTVDGRALSCYDELLALRQSRSDLAVLWQVSVNGVGYDQSAQEIELPGPGLTIESLRELLRRLPELTTVRISDCPFTMDEQIALRDEYPAVTFAWEIPLFGGRYTSVEETVSLAGRQDLGEKDVEELLGVASMLTGWQLLDLTGTSFTQEQRMAISDALPETHVLWDFTWCGVATNTGETAVDLSGIAMADTGEVEAMLPYMYALEKVDMCNCGLSYETMDALVDRHPETRFIFVIDFSRYHVRTDALGFIASIEYYGLVSDEDMLRIAKHCKDMISIDVGHREPAHMDFLAEMPQLMYLVLADGSATDISAFSNLKNLVWLEMTKCSAQDPTPLLECTALESIDIAFTAFPDQQKNYEVFSQMTWLQRLWVSPGQFSAEQLEQLRAALPNTEIYVCTYIGDRCGGTWRENERYFEMRDALQMWYMGNRGELISRKLVNGEWVDAPYTGPYHGISHERG